MPPNQVPGPLGLGPNVPSIDSGTICLAASSAPGVIGLHPEPPLALDAVQWQSEEVTAEVASKVDVDKYLQALGKPEAPALVRERVEVAAEYYEARFPTKGMEQIVGYLKAIDFSVDVRAVKLAAIAPADSILIQRVAEGRPGNFFTKPGFPASQSGIAMGNRVVRQFRVISGSAEVLVSTAAPVSDTWTPGRTLDVYTPTLGRQPWQPPGRAGELVGGGGLQIVIPDPIRFYVTPLDEPS